MNLYQVYSNSYNGITHYIEAESISEVLEIFNEIHKDKFFKPTIHLIKLLGSVCRKEEE